MCTSSLKETEERPPRLLLLAASPAKREFFMCALLFPFSCGPYTHIGHRRAKIYHSGGPFYGLSLPPIRNPAAAQGRAPPNPLLRPIFLNGGSYSRTPCTQGTVLAYVHCSVHTLPFGGVGRNSDARRESHARHLVLPFLPRN